MFHIGHYARIMVRIRVRGYLIAGVLMVLLGRVGVGNYSHLLPFIIPILGGGDGLALLWRAGPTGLTYLEQKGMGVI